MSYLTGYLQAENGNMARDIHALNAKIRELRGYREVDAQEIADLKLAIDQWRIHHACEKTLRMEMMNELDRIHGVGNNPFRKQAYKDADAMRVPSGDRKGEVVTKADHIYVAKFADLFKTLSSKYPQVSNWKKFLHAKVNY